MSQKQKSLRSALPHLIAVLSFIIIGFIYFSPVLEGKKMQQMDVRHSKGMQKELIDYKSETGKIARWTNSMFAGMPAYQIYTGAYSYNVYKIVANIIRLNLPKLTVAIVFLYLIGFYILLVSLRLNPWLSIAGAIAFAFSTYNFVIIEAGHVNKAYAIAFMPIVIAGVMLAFRKRYILGALLTAVGLGLELAFNHVQITYYLLLIVIIIGIEKLIYAIKEKELKVFSKAIGVLILAAILGVLPNITKLWVTAEYGQYTIRGKSELTTPEGKKAKEGLDKNYALAWSYGKAETMTLLIPNFYGGSSHYDLGESSEIYDELRKNGIPPKQAKNIVKQMPTYWGKMPFTSGPVYIGAIVVFLFVLGMFNVRGSVKWWLLAATILGILLSWGKNLPWFTDFFFYNVPFYNKFRTVSMALVIAGLTMPLLAMLGTRNFINKKNEKKKAMKNLQYSYYIVGGISLLFAIMPGLFLNFSTPEDVTSFVRMGFPQAFAEKVATLLPADRAAMVRTDAFRSFVFISLTFGILWLYLKNKLKNVNFVYVGLILFILVDLWGVNKRFVNNDDFVKSRVVKNTFSKSPADEFILQDRSESYRVLNLNNPFNEVNTSYFHQSIGGYHGAKLMRYQELIDHHLQKEIRNIILTLQKQPTDSSINKTLDKVSCINMLNAKYIIYNPKARPIINQHALGNAWFVDNYKIVEDSDAEIKALNNFDPSKTAIIDKRYKKYLEGFTPQEDTLANIELIEYTPDRLTYNYQSSKKQLAVFSEIYYPEGWNAYINGEELPYFRVNYVLRGMVLPKGENTITFEFRPKSYYTGKRIASISSIIVVILILGVAFYEYSRRKKKSKTPKAE